MSTPISEIIAVRMSALMGSPFFVVTENRLRNGMTPSEAIACRSRGAPGGADIDRVYRQEHIPLILHMRS